MKNKNKLIETKANRLRSEAARFETLAGQLAIKAMKSNNDEESVKLEGIVTQHLIRVETFKEAARLVAA